MLKAEEKDFTRVTQHVSRCYFTHHLFGRGDLPAHTPLLETVAPLSFPLFSHFNHNVFVFAATIANQDFLATPSRVRSLSCENIVVEIDSSCKQTPPVIPGYFCNIVF
jgi:hypothetical protein